MKKRSTLILISLSLLMLFAGGAIWLPNDPFDGEPVRYDAQRAILYSVGEDFRDDGGSTYPSRLDQDIADYDERHVMDEFAELERTEPTFHIRFNQKPEPAEAE